MDIIKLGIIGIGNMGSGTQLISKTANAPKLSLRQYRTLTPKGLTGQSNKTMLKILHILQQQRKCLTAEL